jgi:hypothetical protein
MPLYLDKSYKPIAKGSEVPKALIPIMDKTERRMPGGRASLQG